MIFQKIQVKQVMKMKMMIWTVLLLMKKKTYFQKMIINKAITKSIDQKRKRKRKSKLKTVFSLILKNGEMTSNWICLLKLCSSFLITKMLMFLDKHLII